MRNIRQQIAGCLFENRIGLSSAETALFYESEQPREDFIGAAANATIQFLFESIGVFSGFY